MNIAIASSRTVVEISCSARPFVKGSPATVGELKIAQLRPKFCVAVDYWFGDILSLQLQFHNLCVTVDYWFEAYD